MPKKKQAQRAEPMCIRSARSLSKDWNEVPKTLLAYKRGRWVNERVSPARVEDLKKVVFYAKQIRFWLKKYDEAHANKDQGRIEETAFEIGRNVQKLHQHIEASGPRYQQSKLGGQARDKGDLSWQSKVDAKMRGSSVSYSEACRRVAAESKTMISDRTIRNHTRDPRKTNTKF